MKKAMVVMLIIIGFCSMVSECFAHGGGLDSRGGHYVRTAGPGRIVGSYHSHR